MKNWQIFLLVVLFILIPASIAFYFLYWIPMQASKLKVQQINDDLKSSTTNEIEIDDNVSPSDYNIERISVINQKNASSNLIINKYCENAKFLHQYAKQLIFEGWQKYYNSVSQDDFKFNKKILGEMNYFYNSMTYQISLLCNELSSMNQAKALENYNIIEASYKSIQVKLNEMK